MRWVKRMQVATIMTSPVKTIEAGAPLCQAYEVMQRHGVKHLPVVRGRRLVGLVTARLLHGAEPEAVWAKALPSRSTAWRQWRVCDVMTTEVSILPPDTPAREAARLAWEQDVGCFLIMDGDDLSGIVTTTDLLDVFVDRLQACYPSRYDRLLMATDFSEAAAQAMPTAIALARRHRAQLTLLHVLPYYSKFLATDIEHASAETVAILAETALAEALARLEALTPCGSNHIAYRVAHGDPSTAIINTAIAAKADLIIMGQRQQRRPYGLRRGITRRVIKRAPCPILLVQTEARYELVRP